MQELACGDWRQAVIRPLAGSAGRRMDGSYRMQATARRPYRQTSYCRGLGRGSRQRDNLTEQTPCIECSSNQAHRKKQEQSKIAHGGQKLAWDTTPEIDEGSSLTAPIRMDLTPVRAPAVHSAFQSKGTNAAALVYLFPDGHSSGPVTTHHSH